MASVTPAAPHPLETVRALVNTRDVEDATEGLHTPADLGAWLRDVGLLDAGVTATAADHRRAIDLREALRAALAANHDDSGLPDRTRQVIVAVAERADLTLSLTADDDWVARPRAAGVTGALGKIIVIVADAMADGTWRRLKVCQNDSCQWAFYDLSRARSGKWCSMLICGNRAKQQAWRARHERA